MLAVRAIAGLLDFCLADFLHARILAELLEVLDDVAHTDSAHDLGCILHILPHWFIAKFVVADVALAKVEHLLKQHDEVMNMCRDTLIDDCKCEKLTDWNAFDALHVRLLLLHEGEEPIVVRKLAHDEEVFAV